MSISGGSGTEILQLNDQLIPSGNLIPGVHP